MMKTIHKIDMAVIMTSVFVMIFLIGYMRPLVISPIDNYSTSETEVLFSIDNANKILIDDNLGFTTPDEYLVEDGMKINLAPGEYYWKAVGVVGSSVRTLKIISEVNLEIARLAEDHYGIVNSGNVKLNVDIYNRTNLIEQKTLSVDEKEEVIGDKIVGGQYE